MPLESGQPTEFVGRTSWPRPATPYEQFCEKQGVPIYRGQVGVNNLRNLELGDWPRTGGRGAIVDLKGTGGQVGTYLIEVPPGEALLPERHLYEAIFYVLEGRGVTEVWTDAAPARRIFEWGENSIFSPPLNSWHRFVNTSSSPALLFASTNAPPIMELFRNEDFIFGAEYDFSDRYDGSEDYFDALQELGVAESSRRALYAGAVVPDGATLELPIDGQRGYGHRHTFVRLSGNFTHGFLAEYPEGRYSKTHAHASGPILICVKGGGYTLTWPKSAGTTPWLDGCGDVVEVQHYTQGGVVSAAPGGADWFHAHFGVSSGRFRVLAILPGYPEPTVGPPGSEVISMNWNIKEGGNTIEYCDEDPMIRRMFKEAVERAGGKYDMPEDLFQ